MATLGGLADGKVRKTKRVVPSHSDSFAVTGIGQPCRLSNVAGTAGSDRCGPFSSGTRCQRGAFREKAAISSSRSKPNVPHREGIETEDEGQQCRENLV
jgi:hypothetical protein